MLPFATASTSSDPAAASAAVETDPAEADEPKPDAPNCQQLIDAAMRTNVIRFKAGSSDLAATDKVTLDRLKVAAQSCTPCRSTSGLAAGSPQRRIA
jgi:hypothetical protein